MAISISGTNGIGGVVGTAAAPAFTGADADTGIHFGTDTATISPHTWRMTAPESHRS